MEVPTTLGAEAPPPWNRGRASPSRNMAFPHTATMPNMVAISQTVWAWAGRSPKLGMLDPFGWMAWLSPRNMTLPCCVTMPNSVVLCETARACVRKSAEKLDSFLSAFQGHSTSSEPIRIDRLPMTSY